VLLHVYSILVEKDGDVPDEQIQMMIEKDANLSVKATLERLAEKGNNSNVEVKLASKDGFPSKLINSNSLAFDVYVPSSKKMPVSWVDDTFIKSQNRLWFKVIATKAPSTIHVYI